MSWLLTLLSSDWSAEHRRQSRTGSTVVCSGVQSFAGLHQGQDAPDTVATFPALSDLAPPSEVSTVTRARCLQSLCELRVGLSKLDGHRCISSSDSCAFACISLNTIQSFLHIAKQYSICCARCECVQQQRWTESHARHILTPESVQVDARLEIQIL